MKKFLLLAIASALFSSSIYAAELAPLQSDTEPDRTDWTQLDSKYGAMPKPDAKLKIGGVSKTLTNEYWRSLGQGYKNVADKDGFTFAYQAAANEDDQLGQLSIAETLIAQGFNGLLVSPQTDANLQPAYDVAQSKGIAVVNVNDAVMPNAAHYVGNVQKDNGVRVAQWFIQHYPNGGSVAIIEGQPGVYAAGQRTKGFRETIAANGKFKVVASVPANWSREKAYDAASTILQQYPDLIGFYANNDGMALGVVEAVRSAGKSKQTAVFGTDGISDAYASIKRGELTGTVDSFPVLTGEVAMDVMLRLIAGQKISRVVSTPQALITKDNADAFSTKDNEKLRQLLAQQK
ncbi:substrate-binding domain-containing protein [Rouxiella badensis]|jgi:ribose transport system substrate-binding protein|uniref:ABC transporter substrate-binding protein n=1 Tax=Rouxiella badensis TaxID=1646377 RepID=A0A1X0WB18_9GAMM|nr:substrate-binding domain-containing protein [Rouxiella badensis]MCC3704263.1 substrate-binding domain-containing protein [Rouxiella badensis]MCC3719714.1 substrate-binding domain-containing protein [Rouxiella badensis]MCC3728964.1 substrate-binding domain-containing protein [Rouxiella badensis]MCC3733391.1 substrate-binding domain-containing protein [Rouxiella badensis]MCC3740840.1 substrate-binding domain-containing protein [Rouxiella badensis]